jgi:hypothetical protein
MKRTLKLIGITLIFATVCFFNAYQAHEYKARVRLQQELDRQRQIDSVNKSISQWNILLSEEQHTNKSFEDYYFNGSCNIVHTNDDGAVIRVFQMLSIDNSVCNQFVFIKGLKNMHRDRRYVFVDPLKLKPTIGGYAYTNDMGNVIRMSAYELWNGE